MRSSLVRRLAPLLLAGLLTVPPARVGAEPTSVDQLVVQQAATALSSPIQAVFASSQGTLFAQLATGEVQRSDNGGRSWRPEALPPLPNQAELRQLTVDPTGRSVAFARVVRGTVPNPSPFAGSTPVNLYSLLRAYPGDAGWAQIPAPPDDSAGVEVASPADPDVLYATTQPVQRNSASFRVWRTNDGGATWSLAREEQEYGAPCTMHLQPDNTDPLRVFSSGLSCVVTVGGGAPSAPRFQQSRDQGATWSPMFSVDRLRDVPFDSRSLYGRVDSIAGGIAPNPRAFVAKVTYDDRSPGPGGAVFRTLDDGQTWNMVLGTSAWDADVHPGRPAIHAPVPGTPALDPRNPDRLLLADGRASDDGGETWASVGALGTISNFVTTSQGWFAATPGGVVRVDLAHQAITLSDRWQVLASDFDQPSAMAVAPDGSLLVGDRGRVRRMSPDGQVLEQWSVPLPGDQSPRVVDALAQDDSGRIYVAERAWDAYLFTPGASDPPQRINADGRPVHGIAQDGTGNLYLSRQPDIVPRDDPPRAVAVVSVDDGTLVAQWGAPGTQAGQFSAVPWGITLDTSGNVYVADSGNNRVQQFAPDGTLLSAWTGLHAPAGIALDGAGNVYISDSTADRVVELAPDGTPLSSWGALGVSLGQFRQPLGVAVDKNSGTIYVADTLNNRVVRIDRGG